MIPPIGASAPPPVFQGYSEMNLEFEFYADATGIVPIPKEIKSQFENGGKPSIKPYLDKLQNTVYAYNKESHGPPYLEIIWGNIAPNTKNDDTEKKAAVFKAMLESYNVEIQLFSLKGEPIKAKIVLKLKSLVSPDERPLGNSPDVTHRVMIKYGDKMSTLCNGIYGRFDSFICAAVGDYNGLPAWELQGYVGKELIFPSIHLLQEEYLDEWDRLYEEKKAKDAVDYETHYEHMLKLIGRSRIQNYFRTFGFDPLEPIDIYNFRTTKVKDKEVLKNLKQKALHTAKIIHAHGFKEEREDFDAEQTLGFFYDWVFETHADYVNRNGRRSGLEVLKQFSE